MNISTIRYLNCLKKDLNNLNEKINNIDDDDSSGDRSIVKKKSQLYKFINGLKSMRSPPVPAPTQVTMSAPNVNDDRSIAWAFPKDIILAKIIKSTFFIFISFLNY